MNLDILSRPPAIWHNKFFILIPRNIFQSTAMVMQHSSVSFHLNLSLDLSQWRCWSFWSSSWCLNWTLDIKTFFTRDWINYWITACHILNQLITEQFLEWFLQNMNCSGRLKKHKNLTSFCWNVKRLRRIFWLKIEFRTLLKESVNILFEDGRRRCDNLIFICFYFSS